MLDKKYVTLYARSQRKTARDETHIITTKNFSF